MASPSLGSGRTAAAAVFAAAAVLEVVGDALIRKGLRGSGAALVVLGLAVLGGYGVLVNLLDIDFSRLLGAYVGVFAVVSVLIGRFVFRDAVPASTWIGLAVILGGSLVIHLGRGG
jgi:drug/metabolite transporter superfamily protein YnfA